MRVFAIASIAASLMACSAGSEKDADVIASDASELKSSTVQYLGQIDDGETKTVSYSSPPKYRAYGFTAKGGQTITLDVKSTNGGDAMVWLTNSSYGTTYAYNDDASSATLNSHVEYTIPAGTASRAYRIVFRDYDQLSASFSVKLAIDGNDKPEPGTCDPSQEPWRVYKGTPSTCPTIRYTCAAGMVPFENDCGCGCE